MKTAIPALLRVAMSAFVLEMLAACSGGGGSVVPRAPLNQSVSSESRVPRTLTRSDAAVESTLFSFGSVAQGSYVDGPLVNDGDGGYFGVANGGANGMGLIFDLTPTPMGMQENVLYTFLANDPAGVYPAGPVEPDAGGNLWAEDKSGIIALRQVTPGAWSPTLVYACNTGGDERVTIVGTAIYAACTQDSKIVKIIANGSSFTTQIVHTFNNDGKGKLYPNGGLIVTPKGDIYGTDTLGSYESYDGYFFKLSTTGNGTYTIHNYLPALTLWGLTPGKHGVFYEDAVCASANEGCGGSIVKIAPAGSSYVATTIANTNEAEGELTLDSAGNLYYVDGTSLQEIPVGTTAITTLFTDPGENAPSLMPAILGANGSIVFGNYDPSCGSLYQCGVYQVTP